MFGEYEDRKVSIWEELDRKFNQKQVNKLIKKSRTKIKFQ